jgi:hypothetical protein
MPVINAFFAMTPGFPPTLASPDHLCAVAASYQNREPPASIDDNDSLNTLYPSVCSARDEPSPLRYKTAVEANSSHHVRPSVAPVFRPDVEPASTVDPARNNSVSPRALGNSEWQSNRTTKIFLAAITLMISAAMLFTHLGHYALWDDESLVGLIAQGVWRTGDTTAINDRNIVAYRDGLLLKNFKDRSSPPLQYFIVAPFVGLLGPHSWAVRLPMSIMGMACVGLMMRWLWVDKADLGLWIVFVLALLGNVSFFLYFRQCRYYAPSMLLLTATAYLYTHLKSRKTVILLSIVLLLLLTANYMTFAAVVGMLVIDYFFWGRKRRHLDWIDWAIVLLPLLVIGTVVVWIWNPLSINQFAEKGSWIDDRLLLLWWHVRDLTVCELGATLALLAAPFVAVFKKQVGLRRATVALAVGIAVITIASPQKTAGALVADVRYLSSLIPICIAVEAMTLRAVCGRWVLYVGVPIACVLFETNLLQGSWLCDQRFRPPIRSTVGLFIEELADPPPDPFTAAANWINSNVDDSASILVLPDYVCYPLMFHAPKAIYAWQLDDKADPIYQTLPAINFQNRVPPDYIMIFGRAAQPANTLTLGGVIQYPLVATLDVYGRDAFRPEMFLRSFRPITGFDPMVDGIRIYKR